MSSETLSKQKFLPQEKHAWSCSRLVASLVPSISLDILFTCSIGIEKAGISA